jgi:hypothetical protein
MNSEAMPWVFIKLTNTFSFSQRLVLSNCGYNTLTDFLCQGFFLFFFEKFFSAVFSLPYRCFSLASLRFSLA